MPVNLLKIIRRFSFISEKKRLELFPPFWLMRIRVLELAPDWQTVRIKLPLNMVSRNMGDSMFGGFQASLSDPIAALACAKRFPGHDVWTRHHELDFRKVGNTDLELRFEFDVEIEAKIRKDLAVKGRSTPTFTYAYYRSDGVLCTLITSTVAIRAEGYLRHNKVLKN